MRSEFNHEELNKRLGIIERAVNACVEILKDIDPQIENKTYEKGDSYWNIKQRLSIGIQLELFYIEHGDKFKTESI